MTMYNQFLTIYNVIVSVTSKYADGVFVSAR